VHAFSDALGEQRADGADPRLRPPRRVDRRRGRRQGAAGCAVRRPFHIVSWATGALDEVRRQAWRAARSAGQTTLRTLGSRVLRLSTGSAHDLKRARCALSKNPENLTTGQQAKLGWIEKTQPRLYPAYLLKEGLRLPFQFKGEEGKYALSRWLSWAARPS
jgi:transposase